MCFVAKIDSYERLQLPNRKKNSTKSNIDNMKLFNIHRCVAYIPIPIHLLDSSEKYSPILCSSSIKWLQMRSSVLFLLPLSVSPSLHFIPSIQKVIFFWCSSGNAHIPFTQWMCQRHEQAPCKINLHRAAIYIMCMQMTFYIVCTNIYLYDTRVTV